MVATKFDDVLFNAVNAGIFPLSLAAKPIAVLLFDHVKVAPDGKLLSICALMLLFAQTSMFDIGFTIGNEFTVITMVKLLPSHPFSLGVTV